MDNEIIAVSVCGGGRRFLQAILTFLIMNLIQKRHIANWMESLPAIHKGQIRCEGHKIKKVLF